MACSVCTKDSHYIYRITKNYGMEYCTKCLPSFLWERKKAGLLESTDDFKKIMEEGRKNITKTFEKNDEEVTEEEEVFEEKPKPKKKATKKKAE